LQKDLCSVVQKHWVYDGGLATRGWIGRTGVDIGLVSGPDSDRKTPMQAAQSNRPKTDDIVRLLTVRKLFVPGRACPWLAGFDYSPSLITQAACTAAKEGKAQEVQRLVDKNRYKK
jgi:hypothetical protein